MTVIRVQPKSSPPQTRSEPQNHLEPARQVDDLIRVDCESHQLLSHHLNANELRGVEFECEPTHWSWFGRKKRLFAGTKDF